MTGPSDLGLAWPLANVRQHRGKESAFQCRRLKEMWVRSLGGEDPLKKEMATHSSILAWKIPWTEEPGELQSMGSQSRPDRATEHTHTG